MMRRMSAVLLLVMGFAFPPALAQDHDTPGGAHDTAAPAASEAHGGHAAESGHGPKYDVDTVDGMTAVWTIVVFVVLLIVLRAAAWKPIQNVLAERERFIRESLAQAKDDRAAAEVRLAEYAAKLEAAGKEVAAIMEEARRDANVLRRREEEKAREEAERTVHRAKREIELATDSAVKELYAKSAKFATEIAARVIRKELDAAQHERLIAESIEEFQSAGRE